MIVSMGGQTPNNLAMRCAEAGLRILGTSPESIDRAEDRHKFSALCDELGIDQPAWTEVSSIAGRRRVRRAGRLPGAGAALLRAVGRGHGGG